MASLLQSLSGIGALVEQGGPVVALLFLTCLLLWLCILERLWFLRITWPDRVGTYVGAWSARADRRSWRARKIREELVSRGRMELQAVLPLIKVLVTLCPLLGLLGTVLGMIDVFEVIAAVGNDDPRAMARGVYRATLPTLVGLVVALTGLYFTVRLARLAEREGARLIDRLVLHDGAAAGGGR